MELKAYWDERIRTSGRHRSIGQIGVPERVNRHRKLAALEPIERALEGCDVGLDGSEVLDAGCGTGVYSEFYADRGANVSGFDFSSAAIDEIRSREVPGSYTVQQLPHVAYPDGQFDLVHCFSVLYHLIDDEQWAQSIRELARVTRNDGVLLLRIEWIDDPGPVSDHQKQRPKSAYRDVFEDVGLEVRETYPIEDRPMSSRLARWAPRVVTSLDLFEECPSNRVLLLEFEE